jgi:serine phosphatase RsbU (regulator of sigma subunit)
MSPYSIPPLISSLIFISLGIFVFLKNKKATLNRLFVLSCIPTFWWQFSWFILFNVHNNDHLASILVKVGYTGITFITMTFFHFFVVLLDLKKQQLKFVYLGYAIAFILLFFLWTTNLYINGFYRYFFGYYPKANFLHIAHLIHQLIFGGIYVYILMILALRRYKNNPLKYAQTKYMFLAYLIYYPAASDYLANYGVEFYPIGFIFILLTASIFVYNIVRYRLMEIDTVIHRTALWLLTSCSILIPVGALLYFLRPWFVRLNWLQLTFLMTGLFYLFLFYYRKMQPRIDHFFRRRKYDYYQVLSEIGQKIGSELDINSVILRLFKELKEILYIRSGLVLVQLPGQENYSEAGSIGYEQHQPGQEKREAVTLQNQNSLSRWMQIHQRVMEKEQLEVDPQYGPVKEEGLVFLSRNNIELLIPVVMEGKVNALVGIGKKENLQAYTGKDIELLENMGRQIGITIDNALHHEDIVEKERLAEEMKLGREIQMALLPQEVPAIKGLNVRGLMQPAKEIGGDYYDFITLPNKDDLSIVIGDVSGKGVAAGLLMAMAKTAIHTLSQEEVSPKQILLRTNNILNRHIGGQKFMTLLYFLWQEESKTLTYSSAGHEHILVYRKEVPVAIDNVGSATTGGTTAGVIEAIVSGGFMLGMIPDIETYLEDKKIKLEVGDKILLYTDGVTEAQNQAEDRFGLERLIQAFQRHSSKSANELMQAIKEEVYAFIGTKPQYDDITLVVLEAK